MTELKFRIAWPPGGEKEFWETAKEAQLYHEMPPKEFLRLSIEGESIRGRAEDWSSQHWFSPLCERIRRGEGVDPHRLLVESKRCEVISHEGRHRASQSDACGIRKIPVIITCVKAAIRPGQTRRPDYEPVRFEKCLKCIGKGFKPQKSWATQFEIYRIHGSPERSPRRTG